MGVAHAKPVSMSQVFSTGKVLRRDTPDPGKIERDKTKIKRNRIKRDKI